MWPSTSLRTGARRASASRRAHAPPLRTDARARRPHVRARARSELAAFYTRINGGGGGEKQLEVVFASSDRSAAEFQSYFGHMPWTALPHGDARIAALSAKYRVRGIPSLVLLDGATGETVCADARARVGEVRTCAAAPPPPHTHTLPPTPPVGFDLCHKYILYLYLYLYFGARTRVAPSTCVCLSVRLRACVRARGGLAFSCLLALRAWVRVRAFTAAGRRTRRARRSRGSPSPCSIS